jgi:hypothetical protein
VKPLEIWYQSRKLSGWKNVTLATKETHEIEERWLGRRKSRFKKSPERNRVCITYEQSGWTSHIRSVLLTMKLRGRKSLLKIRAKCRCLGLTWFRIIFQLPICLELKNHIRWIELITSKHLTVRYKLGDRYRRLQRYTWLMYHFYLFRCTYEWRSISF